VDAFRRGLGIMEVISAAAEEDVVVNTRVDLEDAEEDRLARAFS
jgi:hypothetical protein